MKASAILSVEYELCQEMFKILHSIMRIHSLANSAIPIIIKSIILQVKHTRFLSQLWPVIYSTSVFLIRGKKKSSDLKITSLVFGDAEFSHYFANLVYSRNYKVYDLMKTAYCDIPKIINHKEVDIVLVQADGVLSEFLSQQGFLILPKIRFTLDISSRLEKIFARMSRLRRRNINKIKERKFTYEVTREPRKLDFFYHKLYLPYIFKRHGKSAKPAGFFAIKQVFRKGGLLLVKLDGKYVSGILYNIFGDKVCACCLGIYEGKKQHLDEGASQAALYFLIEWSKLQGFKEIDYGLCNPFMNDGLFVYKKSWGMRAKPCRDLVYGLRVSNLDTAVIKFLSENPLVFAESRGISGLIFRKVEGETEKVFCASSHYTLGLSRIVIGFYSKRDPSAALSYPTFVERSATKDNERPTIPHLFELWSRHGGRFQVYSSS